MSFRYAILLLATHCTSLYAIEPLIASHTFKRLMGTEVRHLSHYLQQIEAVTHRKIPEHQARRIIDYVDSAAIYRRTKDDIAESRKAFQRRKIMIAADWCYHTGEKMPQLTSIPHIENQEDSTENPWELHHVIFLRMNGENDWWNIFPVPKIDHHVVIHGKDQPGEILHSLLQERIPEL